MIFLSILVFWSVVCGMMGWIVWDLWLIVGEWQWISEKRCNELIHFTFILKSQTVTCLSRQLSCLRCITQATYVLLKWHPWTIFHLHTVNFDNVHLNFTDLLMSLVIQMLKNNVATSFSRWCNPELNSKSSLASKPIQIISKNYENLWNGQKIKS